MIICLTCKDLYEACSGLVLRLPSIYPVEGLCTFDTIMLEVAFQKLVLENWELGFQVLRFPLWDNQAPN